MNSSKTKNVFLAIVFFAIVLLGLGWLYYSSQDTSLELRTDQAAYFADDEPVLNVLLKNSKNAESGKIVVNYPSSDLEIVKLSDL